MLFPDLKQLINLRSALSSRNLNIARSQNRTQGDYTSLFHGLGVEFETVRPYVIGDDVRYIDWRVTARSGKPHVKTFRAESDRNVLIVVDANAYMRYGTRGTFKSIQAAKIAALLCWQSLQQQDRVGGLIFGDIEKGIQYFKPTKTDATSFKMLKTLCNQQINLHAEVSLSSALEHLKQVVTPQSLIFIISDFNSDSIKSIENSLLSLRKLSKVILLPIYDASDIDIPEIGNITFLHAGQRALINTNNPKARKAYTAAWEQFTQQLQQTSKKLKTPMLWIDTACDPVKRLFTNTGSLLTWKS